MKGVAGREKCYVSVISKTNLDGKVIPLSIQWRDGATFTIERILDQRKACSLKCGGMGVRYTVQIFGKATYLFWENPRWFVEAKIPEHS